MPRLEWLVLDMVGYVPRSAILVQGMNYVPADMTITKDHPLVSSIDVLFEYTVARR